MSYGTLKIPSLLISVPLYEVTSNLSAQDIVDAFNSAVFMKYGNQYLIADHVSQGKFWNLIKCKSGKTKAKIISQDGTVKNYICVVNQQGFLIVKKESNRLYDWKWESVIDKNPNGLVIYTCQGLKKDNIQNVTLTYWKEISEYENEIKTMQEKYAK